MLLVQKRMEFIITETKENEKNVKSISIDVHKHSSISFMNNII